MNSQKLKISHPEAYRKFFCDCQRVVSAPHSFLWTGDFSGFYGGLTISSKIPLRFYVGLEAIGKNSFEVSQEMYAYNPQDQAFCVIRLDDQIVEAIKKEVGTRLMGYKIHFFSELTLGLSLGGLGAMSACIASLIFEGKKERVKLACNLVNKLQQGRSSAATAFSALSVGAYPSVFYSSDGKYWGKSLDELDKLPSKPIFPFDFGLIFSGNLVQGSAVIRSAEEIRRLADEREERINNILGKNPSKFWPTYLAMLEQISYQSLSSLIDIMKNGSKISGISEFFDTLNQYQNLLHFLKVSTSNIDKIYSSVHRVSNKSDNEIGSGCKITGVGKGGEVLFAVPFGQYRNKITQTISELSQDMSLDYSSWEDGIEERGVLIEQDLDRDIYSDFISKGMRLLRVYTKDRISTRFISEQFDLKSLDIVMDEIKNKIFINGKPVDSTLIPSQKATVQIVARLLGAKDLNITNNKLPKSYGTSRYDLQSKITTPLEKITVLKFEISGGAYDNYILKLKPFDISIAIIGTI